jgi:hypothetical protein
MSIIQLQHTFPGDAQREQIKKAWLKQKLSKNEPVDLEELVAGQKVWELGGYTRKDSAQGPLVGHRHAHQSPVVPRDHWSEEDRLFRPQPKKSKQAHRPAIRCFLSCYGFKLWLMAAPNGATWRAYLVACEQELQERNRADSRSTLAERQVESASALFDAGYGVKALGEAKGALTCRLYGRDANSIKEEIKEVKSLRGQAKGVNMYNHATRMTMAGNSMAQSMLTMLALTGGGPGAIAPERLGVEAAKRAIRQVDEMSGGALIAKSSNGMGVLEFEIDPRPAMTSRRRDRLKAGRSQDRSLRQADNQQQALF